MKNILNVSVCEMTSVDNWSENAKTCLELLELAKRKTKNDLISFPENSLFMRKSLGDSIEARNLEDSVFDVFAEWAKANDCCIYFGSLPLKIGNSVFNSSVVISNEGKRSSPYQKIHLFDIELDGQEPLKESDEYDYGQSPSVINVKGWKVGLSICYDLRFSELYSRYAREEVDLIAVPAAFLVKTGQAHWHVLLRARAIESQCYVIAPAQGGKHPGGRETFGHSLIVDPWGTVVEESNVQKKVISASLDKGLIANVRRQIPMKNHRRI